MTLNDLLTCAIIFGAKKYIYFMGRQFLYRVSQKKRLQDFMFTFYILEDIIFTLDHQKSLQIEEESGGNNLLFTKLIYLQNWSVQKGANFSIFLTP